MTTLSDSGPKISRVALLGGGRWARVHAEVLARILPRSAEVHWVSRHNRAAIGDFVAKHPASVGPTFQLAESREEAFSHKPDAAIVATAPHQHFGDGVFALDLETATLIEKPLALNEREAEQLVDLAAARGLILGIGLTYMMATYLQHLSRIIADRALAQIVLRWFDPPFEVRHGEAKAADLTVHKAHDIFPHLWSILNVLRPGGEVAGLEVEPDRAGALSARFDWRGARVSAAFGRRGARRERRIQLSFVDGGTIELDFASEPGRLTMDGAARAPDPDWDHAPRPLTAEISSFLGAAAGDADAGWPLTASRCLGSVSGAVMVCQLAQKKEAAALARAIAAGEPGQNPDVVAWMVDNLAPDLVGQHRLTLLDTDAISALVRDGLEVLAPKSPRPDPAARFAASPFLAEVRRHLPASAR